MGSTMEFPCHEVEGLKIGVLELAMILSDEVWA